MAIRNYKEFKKLLKRKEIRIQKEYINGQKEK
jgi:hypothetical protein